MAKLEAMSCKACRGDVPALDPTGVSQLVVELDHWTVVANHHLTKTFSFADFAGALAYANRIAVIAEQEGHHPDLHLAWGRLVVEIWTHKVDGLTESDFVLAAKIDALGHPDAPTPLATIARPIPASIH